MDIQQVLSPKLIGATYALLKGDLVTAQRLGQESIHDEPFNKEAYLLLTYACSGLGLWQNTAEYARIAFCMGVEDERLLALLTGMYQAINMEHEANWLTKQFNVDAFDLSQSLSSDDQLLLKNILLSTPRMPQKSRRSQHGYGEKDDERNNWTRFSNLQTTARLPNWLETAETVQLNQLAIKRPNWINEESDGLEAVFRIPIQRANWLEDNEQFNLDYVSSAPTDSSDSPYQNLPGAEDQESNYTISDDDFILEAVEQATLLGLGTEFSIAIELAELNLAQENGKNKKLFGPLILAISGPQLIIVAYEGDMLRQKPWAFSSTQLEQTSFQNNEVTLTVQGNRSISFNVGAEEQAKYLVQKLSQWH